MPIESVETFRCGNGSQFRMNGAASASSISIRASPASRARWFISFCKQRRSSSRIFTGVEAGKACQSGSSLNTAARISVVVSP